MSERLRIVRRIGGRRVELFVGRGILREKSVWGGLSSGFDRVCVVADAFSASRFLPPLREALRATAAKPCAYVAPRGERAKTFSALRKLQSFLLENGLSRSSVLLALGGGTVGDLAGFAAATYMRGIRWISVPTTLLSQVDAGAGGKVGVNLDGTKNAVGAFWQPDAVVCDTACLGSLDAVQRLSGLGEIVKYALVFDAGMYRRLERDWRAVLELEEPFLTRTIVKCLRLKLRVVARDEREEKGAREALNFGHTFGHALESLCGGALSHGEAVIWGMRAAARLSRELGFMAPAMEKEISSFLWRLPARRWTRELDGRLMVELISRDKKRRDGKNRLVLLRRPGRAVVCEGLADGVIARAANGMLSMGTIHEHPDTPRA